MLRGGAGQSREERRGWKRYEQPAVCCSGSHEPLKKVAQTPSSSAPPYARQRVMNSTHSALNVPGQSSALYQPIDALDAAAMAYADLRQQRVARVAVQRREDEHAAAAVGQAPADGVDLRKAGTSLALIQQQLSIQTTPPLTLTLPFFASVVLLLKGILPEGGTRILPKRRRMKRARKRHSSRVNFPARSPEKVP